MNARFTGCDIDGGMAEYTVADERFCFPLPAMYPAEQAAPLLRAGLIGFRSLHFPVRSCRSRCGHWLPPAVSCAAAST